MTDTQSAELVTAERQMYASRLKAVCNRIKMRVAAGGQASRDELAQVDRYSRLIAAA